jgi:formamidopyrimidine-DNA glycosylase
MPELPEVETIRRALLKHLPGKQINKILVRDARLRWPVDENKLRQLIAGDTIADIDRRAKYLLVRMQKSATLIMHLGMSGRLLYITESRLFEKHDHVIFYFEDETELRFRDPRWFGMVDAIPPDGEKDYPRLTILGAEPLDKSLLAGSLYERAKNLTRPIKNLLMDANFIVGVGNIYASEALSRAAIHPAKPAGKLTAKQWPVLLANIRKVLTEAIQKGGTTLNDFVNSDGESGYFQLMLAVYGREGEPCLKCGSPIQRIVQTGRSTFFCPKCQA